MCGVASVAVVGVVGVGGVVVGSVKLEGARAQAAQASAEGASLGARAEGGPGGGAQSTTSRSSATHHHQSTAASAARGLLSTEIRAPWGRAVRSGPRFSRQRLNRSDSGQEATRERARCHTATAAPLPTAHDRARTLFRERRSSPPARSVLPILREIAGGR